VFKEYETTDQLAAATYDNETSIYRNLNKDERTHKNVVGFHGSFQTSEKGTIVLEYADGGDLLNFFKQVPPPSQAKHLTVFLINFFELLCGLEAVHNLKSLERGRKKWVLEG
jgi:serine/threonine protein kinase